MGKDTLLINIYLKIHNKQSLTMDELGYLAQHDPECFRKTCKNVVYNIPESKPIMEPDVPPPKEQKREPESAQETLRNIEAILDNLKRLEANDFPVTSVKADEVMSLLGNLYMELLFPHNDQDSFFNIWDVGNGSIFDKKA